MLRHAPMTPSPFETAETERWLPEQRYSRRRVIWLVDPLNAIPGEGLLPSRTWAVARALVAAGHEVIWWTSSFSHARKIVRTPPLQLVAEEGFQVRLIAARRYSQDYSRARFASHRDFARTFQRVACESVAAGQLGRPDLLVAASPPPESAEAALRVARRLDAELIVDVTEWWPEPLRPLLPGPAWLAALMAALRFPAINRHQQLLLGQADALLASSRTVASQLRSTETAKLPLKVVPTGAYVQDYVPPRPLIDQVPGPGRSRDEPNDHDPLSLSIAVGGDLDDRADLLRLVDVARALSSRQVSAVLQVVGGGRWMARLAAAAPLVKGSCRIEVHGLLDRTRYVGLLSSCQIGLVLPGLLNRFPLPAVASDYAAAGLALVLAASGECAEMVTAAEAGLVANDAQPDNLAGMIASLATNPPLLSRHRQAARRLAENSLDRERLSAELADWLESLATVDGSARRSD
ncbi:MAG: hypothetical protein RLZZ622_1101 [Planctomycetota bacterium]